MLDPNQTARLQGHIPSGKDFSAFEGYRIERRHVAVRGIDSGAEVLVRAFRKDAQIYAPGRVFGTSYDVTRLTGIGND